MDRVEGWTSVSRSVRTTDRNYCPKYYLIYRYRYKARQSFIASNNRVIWEFVVQWLEIGKTMNFHNLCKLENENTHCVKYMVVVAIDTPLLFVSVVLHWEPLSQASEITSGRK